MVKGTNIANGKMPPQATDIEESILGGVMTQPALLLEVMDIIDETSFYKEVNQHIYKAITKLNKEQKSIDILTVTHKLKKMGMLEAVGGPYYITMLTNSPANVMNIENNARIVQEKKIARDLIVLGTNLVVKAYNETTDILDLSEDLVTKAYSIGDVSSGDKELSNAELVAAVTRNMELARNQQGITGLRSGMEAIDKVLLGYQDTNFIIKAGRPAMGKSAEALCEALHMAIFEEKDILFFSLEMSAVELTQRAISVLSEIPLPVIKSGELSMDQWDEYNKASTLIINSGLRFVDIPGLSLNALVRIAKKHKMKKGLSAIYIDYIQLMNNSTKGGNREQEISEISRGLKRLAKELKIPVIALAQLSRAVEQRGGAKKPMLSDLRESGSLEQDADIVQFLYRPEYYGITEDDEGTPTIGIAYLMIAKNRHGETKDIPLHFNASCTKFSDIEAEYHQPTVSPEDYNPNRGIEARKDFDTDNIDNNEPEESDVPF